jgi:AraC-like DNA-binding protein
LNEVEKKDIVFNDLENLVYEFKKVLEQTQHFRMKVNNTLVMNQLNNEVKQNSIMRILWRVDREILFAGNAVLCIHTLTEDDSQVVRAESAVDLFLFNDCLLLKCKRDESTEEPDMDNIYVIFPQLSGVTLGHKQLRISTICRGRETEFCMSHIAAHSQYSSCKFKDVFNHTMGGTYRNYLKDRQLIKDQMSGTTSPKQLDRLARELRLVENKIYQVIKEDTATYQYLLSDGL